MIQATAQPLCMIPTGTELPEARKGFAFVHTGSLWSYPTLCNPVDCGLPGFFVRGILLAGMLEWVAIPFLSIFPAALATGSCKYPMLPGPLQPKQLSHLHTWPSLGQIQVLRGSLSSKHL